MLQVGVGWGGGGGGGKTTRVSRLLPETDTDPQYSTGTKPIHTTDSRSSEHFSLTFGRYAGRIPVGAPVIPRTCAFAQSAVTSSLTASLVRTRNSSFLRDCVRLRSQKAQTSRKYCGLVPFHRTRSFSSEIIFFLSPTQGTVRIFTTLYEYDYFTKRTRTEGI